MSVQHYAEHFKPASTDAEYHHSTKQSSSPLLSPPPHPPLARARPEAGLRTLDSGLWGSAPPQPGSRSHPHCVARAQGLDPRIQISVKWWEINGGVKICHHSSIEFLLCVHCDGDLAGLGMGLATDNIFMHYKLYVGLGPVQTNRRCLKGRAPTLILLSASMNIYSRTKGQA